MDFCVVSYASTLTGQYINSLFGLHEEKKGWTFEVKTTVDQLNMRETVDDSTRSVKTVMRDVREKLFNLDNIECIEISLMTIITCKTEINYGPIGNINNVFKRKPMLK